MGHERICRNIPAFLFSAVLCLSHIIDVSGVSGQVTSRTIFFKSFSHGTDTVYVFHPTDDWRKSLYDTLAPAGAVDVPGEVISSGAACLVVRRVKGSVLDSVRIKVKPVVTSGIISGDSLWYIGSASTYGSVGNTPVLLSLSGAFDPVAGFMVEVKVDDAVQASRWMFEWRTNAMTYR